MSTEAFSQFLPNTNNGNTIIARPGQTGIGFANGPDFESRLGTTPPIEARFVTTNGLMGHLQDGLFGDLFDGSTWSSLGQSGGGPGATAYGLITTAERKVGVLNLIDATSSNGGKELILGWGDNLERNTNYFKLNSLNSLFSPPKTVMYANPRGAIGVNAEPISAIYVDTRNSNIIPADQNPLGGVPGSNQIFQAIAIENDQRVEDSVNPSGIQQSASSIGKQGNSSLIESSVVAEGFRGQIPSFSEALAPGGTADGVAINVQVVNDPQGIPNFPQVFSQQVPQSGFNNDYAELSWQDFAYLDDVTTDCSQSTQAQKKLFFSFRNGQPGTPGNNSFSQANKRVVATMTGNGRLGVNTTSPICELNGDDVFLTVAGGAVVTGALFNSSDRRYKRDIQPIENAMDKIRAIEGTSYEMRTDEFPDLYLGEGLKYGFIAQDLEEVMPEMTAQNSQGYYSVNYQMMIPVLTEALKEQDEEMVELRSRIDELEALVKGTPGDLKDGGTFDLKQNRPNPAANYTIIEYMVPEESNNVSISIYDLTGKLINKYSVSGSRGELQVDLSEMADGMYIYDLQINGDLLTTRKMIVARS